MKRCTALDVATAAGVSKMTVSNVVNGRFGMMNPATRQRVEEAIAALNYQPHAAGRSLRLDERLTIGVLIVDESPAFLADPFTTNLVAGLSNHLNERGYGLLVQGTTPREMRNAVFMRRFGTDGLCVLLSGTAEDCAERLTHLQTLGQPLIVLEAPTPRRKIVDVCFVRQDNFHGAKTLAEHVLSLGARRILHLVPRLHWPAIMERRRGIAEALRAASRAKLDVLASNEGYNDTQNALSEYLETHAVPDAVMGGNDQMGIAAMRLLIERGYRVPEQVMITGFNAFEFRLHTDPVLTSVISAAYEIGSRAGEEMLQRLTRGGFSKSEITLPTQFVLGKSTFASPREAARAKRRSA